MRNTTLRGGDCNDLNEQVSLFNEIFQDLRELEKRIKALESAPESEKPEKKKRGT